MKNKKAYIFEYNRIIKENDNVYRDAAKSFNIAECELWILYFLRVGGISTQSDLCSVMLQSKQTINSALKSMQTKSYLELKNTDDRRKKKISLTEKGKLLAKGTADLVIKLEQESLDELTDDEKEAFISLFDKYTKILKQKAERMKSDLRVKK